MPCRKISRLLAPFSEITIRTSSIDFCGHLGSFPRSIVSGIFLLCEFLDTASNFNWVFPMARKSDVYNHRWAERHSGKRILTLQTDNALEFHKLERCLAELGISHRMSALYSHQQMGPVERHHHHIIDTTITMINHTKFPPSMWDFRVLTTCYLYNSNLTPILQGRSLLEVLFGKSPEYAKLRVYQCYPCMRPYRSNKLAL